MKEIMMEKEVNGKHIEKMVPETIASTYEKAGWKVKKEQPKSQEEQSKPSSSRFSNSRENSE